MSAKIQLSPATAKYLKQLRTGTQKRALHEKILVVMDRQAALTAGYISKNYLSGQRLNRITGTLARSIVGTGEQFRGLPSMRVGVLTGPALAYAAILEVGTKDYNPESPFTKDRNGLPLTGRRPRHYLRDGMAWGVENVTDKIEQLVVDIMEGNA